MGRGSFARCYLVKVKPGYAIADGYIKECPNDPHAQNRKYVAKVYRQGTDQSDYQQERQSLLDLQGQENIIEIFDVPVKTQDK